MVGKWRRLARLEGLADAQRGKGLTYIFVEDKGDGVYLDSAGKRHAAADLEAHMQAGGGLTVTCMYETVESAPLRGMGKTIQLMWED